MENEELKEIWNTLDRLQNSIERLGSRINREVDDLERKVNDLEYDFRNGLQQLQDNLESHKQYHD